MMEGRERRRRRGRCSIMEYFDRSHSASCDQESFLFLSPAFRATLSFFATRWHIEPKEPIVHTDCIAERRRSQGEEETTRGYQDGEKKKRGGKEEDYGTPNARLTHTRR
jgi:hypothetical protein